jgi:hypothetical protein
MPTLYIYTRAQTLVINYPYREAADLSQHSVRKELIFKTSYILTLLTIALN